MGRTNHRFRYGKRSSGGSRCKERHPSGRGESMGPRDVPWRFVFPSRRVGRVCWTSGTCGTPVGAVRGGLAVHVGAHVSPASGRPSSSRAWGLISPSGSEYRDWQQCWTNPTAGRSPPVQRQSGVEDVRWGALGAATTSSTRIRPGFRPATGSVLDSRQWFIWHRPCHRPRGTTYLDLALVLFAAIFGSVGLAWVPFWHWVRATWASIHPLN